jgi:enterochelin esterase-like enzyme
MAFGIPHRDGLGARMARSIRTSSWLRALLACCVGGVAFAVFDALGVVGSTSDALGAMGFDPDRTLLITALFIEALVVAAAVIATGRSWGAIAAGCVAFVVLYHTTFETETARALSPSAAGGTFDAAGWVTTLAALAITVIVAGVAAALLTASARSAIIEAVAELRNAIRQRRTTRRSARALALLVAVAVVAFAAPVFGDMVNYGPDVRMVSGAPVPVGLAGGDATGAGPSPTGLPGTVGTPAVVGASGKPVLSGAKPWLAWRPSGTGTVAKLALPGPWRGVSATTATLFVYTPPGYASGARHYPVIYEVPWGITGYETYLHITLQLDALITRGAIPAEIVVFASEGGGPYPDTECINSADGREWMERYIVGTVVPYIDSHYRTIASPAARSLLGFSQGGYCAPMLLLRHPDVFNNSIVFSGYFEAAPRSGHTPNAWRPYGGDKALIAATSPLLLVNNVPAAVRPSLFFALSADPREQFYGPQYVTFAAALQTNGIAVALFPTPLGHAWAALRQQLPSVLETLASHQAETGVFRQ